MKKINSGFLADLADSNFGYQSGYPSPDTSLISQINEVINLATNVRATEVTSAYNAYVSFRVQLQQSLNTLRLISNDPIVRQRNPALITRVNNLITTIQSRL